VTQSIQYVSPFIMMLISLHKSPKLIALVLLLIQTDLSFGQPKKFSGPYSINSSSGLFNTSGREIKGTATYYYIDGDNYSKIYNGKFDFHGEMYVEDGLQVGYDDGFLGGNNTNDLLVFQDNFGSMKFDLSGNFVQDEKHGKWVSNYYPTRVDDYEKKSMKIIRNFENGFLTGEQSISYTVTRYNYEKRLSEYRHFVLRAEFSKNGPVNRLSYYDTVYYENQSERGYSHTYTANYDDAGKFDGITEFTHNIGGVVYMDKRTFLHGLLLEFVQLNRNNGIVYAFGDAIQDYLKQLDEKLQAEVDAESYELGQLQKEAKYYKELSNFVANIDKYNRVILSNAQIERHCRQLRNDYNNSVYKEVPYQIEFINSLVRNGLPLLFITIDPLAMFGNYLPSNFEFLLNRNYDGDINEDVQSDRPDQTYFLSLFENKNSEVLRIQYLEEEKKRIQDSIELVKIKKQDSVLCQQLSGVYLLDTIEAYTMLKDIVDLKNCPLSSTVIANHNYKTERDEFLKRRSDTLSHDRQVLTTGLGKMKPWTLEALGLAIQTWSDSFYLEEYKVAFLSELTRTFGTGILQFPDKNWFSILQAVQNQNCSIMESFSLNVNPFNESVICEMMGSSIPIEIKELSFSEFNWIPEPFSHFVDYSIDVKVGVDTLSFTPMIYKVSDRIGIAGCLPDSIVNNGYSLFLNEENGKYFIVQDVQDMRKSDMKRKLETSIFQGSDYRSNFEHSYFKGQQMKFVSTFSNESIGYRKQYSTSKFVDGQRLTIHAVYTNGMDFKSRKSEVMD